MTLLFSRTEITAADDCVADDRNVARLDREIAPYLAAHGIVGTGTLVTDATLERAPACAHVRRSIAASWSQATALARLGWSFVSHTATYPHSLARLTPAEAMHETCGSAQTIDAHGLNGGHGLIAYPGAQPEPTALQASYGAACFAWGRHGGNLGTTSPSAGVTPPFWQNTEPPAGGPCNDRRAACYWVVAEGSRRYALPAKVIAHVKALRPGQWFTLQAFVEVTNTNPAYASSPIRWDCRSADPNLHWTNDVERYCYRDWRAIVAALMTLPHVVFTDPLSVGIAFGRPATYPRRP